MVSWDAKGLKISKESVMGTKLTIQGDQWTYRFAKGKEAKHMFKIDTLKQFKTIDLTSKFKGSNLLGGLFGGAIEYLSMMMGLQFLFLLVTAFYGLSLLTLKGRVATAAGNTSKPALREVLAGQSS